MKRILTIVLLLGLLVGCSNKAKEKEPIKFATIPAEASLPIIIAYEKKMFNDSVEIIPFASPADRNAAAQSGQVNALIADVMTALPMIEAGVDMRITSDINEDFKILASPNSNVTSVKDLDGKDVAVIPKFFLQWVMDVVAEDAGITYNIVNVPAFNARYEGLLNDQFAGLVFPEPQAGMLIEQGATLLGSSMDYGLRGGALLFSADYIKENRSEVIEFYEAYNKAVDYINATDPKEYVDILAKYNFPPQMESYLAQRAHVFEHANIVAKDQFDMISTWSKEQKLITKDYLYEFATDFTLIPKN